MGFASGMRAGQLAVEGAIDQYNAVKERRDAREVEEELAGLQTTNQQSVAQSTADSAAYDAEASRLANLNPNQFAAQQAGLGATPAGSVAQASAVAPAPRTPAQQALGLGGPPAKMSANPGTQLGLGAAPEQVAAITPAEVARKREGLLRARGQTQLADRAAIFADRAERTQREIARDEYNQGRDKIADKRWEIENERDAQEFKQQMELNGYLLDDKKELASVRDAVNALKQYGSPQEMMESPEYQSLTATQREAVAARIGNLSKVEMGASRNYVAQQVDRATDFASLVQTYNDEDAITDGVTIEPTQLPDGSVRIDTYNDATGSLVSREGDLKQRELTSSMTFPSQKEAENYLRQTATDPATAATYYATEKAALRAAAAAAAESSRGDQVKALETINKLRIQYDDPEGVFSRLPPNEKEKAWANALSAYKGILSPAQLATQMGGRPDPAEADPSWYERLTSGSTSPQDEGLVRDPNVALTTGEAVDEITGAIGGGLRAAGEEIYDFTFGPTSSAGFIP